MPAETGSPTEAEKRSTTPTADPTPEPEKGSTKTPTDPKKGGKSGSKKGKKSEKGKRQRRKRLELDNADASDSPSVKPIEIKNVGVLENYQVPDPQNKSPTAANKKGAPKKKGSFFGCAISGNGRRAMATAEDETNIVGLWELDTGREAQQLVGHALQPPALWRCACNCHGGSQQYGGNNLAHVFEPNPAAVNLKKTRARYGSTSTMSRT